MLWGQACGHGHPHRLPWEQSLCCSSNSPGRPSGLWRRLAGLPSSCSSFPGYSALPWARVSAPPSQTLLGFSPGQESREVVEPVRHPTLLPPRDGEFQSLEGRTMPLHRYLFPLPPCPVAYSIKTEHPTMRAGRTSLLSSCSYLLAPFTTYHMTEELRTSACLWPAPSLRGNSEAHLWLCHLDQGLLTSTFSPIHVRDVYQEASRCFEATEVTRRQVPGDG